MTATTYVRADKDELIVDVTGADPNATQTARINLQSGRNPTAGASGGIARARRDVGRHRQRQRAAPARRSARSPRSPPAAQNVTASVVDARTVEVSFKPNADGSFRVIVGRPTWAGGDAQATAASLLGTDATASRDRAAPRHLQLVARLLEPRSA